MILIVLTKIWIFMYISVGQLILLSTNRSNHYLLKKDFFPLLYFMESKLKQNLLGIVKIFTWKLYNYWFLRWLPAILSWLMLWQNLNCIFTAGFKIDQINPILILNILNYSNTLQYEHDTQTKPSIINHANSLTFVYRIL